MPGTQVVTGELHRVRRGHGKRFSAEPEHEPSLRPARIAVTLALAHMIQRAIDRGEIRDQAEAARRLGVTRARITQLIGLTFLSPDLQERLLAVGGSPDVRVPTERQIRASARLNSWSEQESTYALLAL
jgi:predicted XRE-type DNA-binding protein